MINYLWKYFPVFYVLPFLLATSRISFLAQFGEMARWGILLVAFILIVRFGFRRERGKYIQLHLVDIIIITFLVIFLLSASWSIAAAYTAMRSISLILIYLASFWLLWRYANQFSGDFLVRTFLYTIGVCLAVNLVIGGILNPSELLSTRFSGLFVNPNNIGMFCGLSLPLTVSFWLRSRKKIDLTIALLVLISLVLAGTRSAMLGSVVAITAILISLFVVRPGRAVLIAVFGGTALLLLIQTQYFEENILRENTLENASNRTFFWELSKSYIKNRPYLGHGFGTDALIHEYYHVDLKRLNLRGYGVMSSYYGLAVAVGKPLTVAFVLLLAGFTLFCMVRYWKDCYLMSYSATVGSGLIICIFEPVIYSAGNAFSFLFWACVMLAVKRCRLLKNYSKRQEMARYALLNSVKHTGAA